MAPDDTPAARIAAGDLRAAARLMRDLDDQAPSARQTLRALFPRTGRAYVVGLTGSPGAGKSTLTDRLIAWYRRQGKTVGVVAVDPTSPFSGGAILGDRIRMQEHALDEGVFIRSMATRGNLGGLSRATADVVSVMDAMGKDVVLVETVGVGQDEIEVASLAHTVVVVSVPGLGDDVQAIKAGVLEIADVFAVNKADREGADRTVRDLQMMLELRRSTATRPPPDHDELHRSQAGEPWSPEDARFWEPPIVKTVATRDEGVEDLVRAVEAHRTHLESTGMWQEREAGRARAAFVALLRERLMAGALALLAGEQGRLDEIAARIAARQADPYALVEELAARLRGGTPMNGPPAPPPADLAPDELRLVADLAGRIGYHFPDPALALVALTHKSFANEARASIAGDNERLEFLGDAVIDLAVSHRLVERFPEAQEGDLSKIRAALVDEPALARLAQRLDLGPLLRLGRGEELTGGRGKASLLADALEAVIAVIYLGGGLEPVLALLDRHLADAFERAAAGTLDRDFKTQLQEWAQSRLRAMPRYRVVAEHGPEHEKIFEVELELRGEVIGRGAGRSKKDAEQAAARSGLVLLEARGEPPEPQR